MKTRLKVLLPVHVFFPKHFYGTETYTLELAKSLKTMGHDPVILTATQFGEEGAGTLLSEYEYAGLKVRCIDLNVIPYQRFKDTYYRPELYPTLKEVVDQEKPDIAHVTHLIHHTTTLLEVLRDSQVPAIATLTDFYGFCFTNILQAHTGRLCSGPTDRATNCFCCYLRVSNHFAGHPVLTPLIKNDILLRLACALLPAFMKTARFRETLFGKYIADIRERLTIVKPRYDYYRYMVAPTDFLYDAYVANGFPVEKLRKINFGLNMEVVRGCRNTKKVTNQELRFGYIGQIAPHKGVDLLINAFLRLKSNHKSLTIYGNQNQDVLYMEKLSILASKDRRIEFCGTFPSDELGRRLSELDVLVIPSRWHENSPLVLLYALATKTPVIVSDAKGMTEFVKDGVNGFSFKMNSLGNLTGIMQRVVDDPSLIQRLSEKATYDKDVSSHARDIVTLYNNVLHHH